MQYRYIIHDTRIHLECCLQHDTHNPNMSDKMSQTDFLGNCKLAQQRTVMVKCHATWVEIAASNYCHDPGTKCMVIT